MRSTDLGEGKVDEAEDKQAISTEEQERIASEIKLESNFDEVKNKQNVLADLEKQEIRIVSEIKTLFTLGEALKKSIEKTYQTIIEFNEIIKATAEEKRYKQLNKIKGEFEGRKKAEVAAVNGFLGGLREEYEQLQIKSLISDVDFDLLKMLSVEPEPEKIKNKEILELKEIEKDKIKLLSLMKRLLVDASSSAETSSKLVEQFNHVLQKSLFVKAPNPIGPNTVNCVPGFAGLIKKQNNDLVKDWSSLIGILNNNIKSLSEKVEELEVEKAAEIDKVSAKAHIKSLQQKIAQNEREKEEAKKHQPKRTVIWEKPGV